MEPKARPAAPLDVEELMARAFQLQEAGDVAAARTCYREADTCLRQEGGARRALVLVSLGELERASGNLADARHLLDEALASAPEHIAALRGRAALAMQTGEHAIAAAMLHRLIAKVDDDAERSQLLETVASESLEAARLAIESALKLRPDDVALLEREREVCAALGDWQGAVAAAVEEAELVTDKKRRAQRLVEAASICSEKAGNTAQAVALFEAAIEDDPEVVGAFEAIEAELRRQGDHEALVAAYERQIARLEGRAARQAQADLLGRLAHLLHTKLKSVQAAIAALERYVVLRPSDQPARLQLAALFEESGDFTKAIRCLEAAAQVSPDYVPIYQKFGELIARGDDKDREYLSCAALVALGEADINQQLLYSQYAPETLPQKRLAFDADIFDELAPPWHPGLLDAVFQALERAALQLWYEDHAALVASMLPSDKSRVNAKRSTVSAVKSFVWASQVLGVTEPLLYIEADNARVSVATLPTPEPALLLGRSVLSGRSLIELGFIAVHHLCYSRPGWKVLAFWTDPSRLQALLSAAASLGKPELAAQASGYSAQLGGRLEQALADSERHVLERAFEGVAEHHTSLDVVSWARGVEQIACRAALLASGDVTVARSVLAVAGTPMGGESAADRASTLVPFAISQRFSALRHLVGTSIG